MQFRVDTVSLSTIDTSDSTFRITTNRTVKDLETSIKTVGLMNPPFVIPKPSAYRIVTGFRRIDACQNLGCSTIVAKVLETGTPDIECVKLAVSDNSFQRSLNLIEISRATRLICSLITEDEILLKTATQLGLPESLAFLKKTESLCNLPPKIQQGILAGSIPLAMALELAKIEEHDLGQRFAEIFNTLRPSLNKQREIINLVAEIAARENLSIRDVLQEKALKELIDTDDFDNAQKLRILRRYLKTRRFPEITKFENEFEKCIKNLNLDPGLKLIPPKNFEGRYYTLQMLFTDLTDLQEQKTKLEKLFKDPGFAAFLKK